MVPMNVSGYGSSSAPVCEAGPWDGTVGLSWQLEAEGAADCLGLRSLLQPAPSDLPEQPCVQESENPAVPSLNSAPQPWAPLL